MREYRAVAASKVKGVTVVKCKKNNVIVQNGELFDG